MFIGAILAFNRLSIFKAIIKLIEEDNGNEPDTTG